ncbi:hypothetical protein GTW43_29255 [Streptomyces sp. SID5785]|uniref:hypothetical protein n=1 Tax=Streptomyces sp. SID5785 TaxID=2690309 RepID=UPI0013619609|nr:hypothetical protein [Streptomyces sp. SID5785]MZD09136.1 hypothetical protein [Streptomyces sp. SID5785]
MTTQTMNAAALTDQAAETIRSLNYATLPEASGLAFPGDAYSTVGNLSMLAMRLPQALHQVQAFIDRQHESGDLYSDQGPDDLSARIASLRAATDDAARAAHTLYAALEQAHVALSPIGARGHDLDDEEDEFDYCDRCEEEGETGEVYPHCCRCGADGSGERPDCLCD